MFLIRLLLGFIGLLLSIFLAVFVVFWSYKSFAKVKAAQVGYNLEEELRKGNVAVAILLTALMVATSFLVQESVYPIIGTLTVYLESPGDSGISLTNALALCAGHLALGFFLSIGSMEFATWLFEKLAAKTDHEGEIRRGNVAVAVVMAGVIGVTALYLQGGISGLTKALIPQPSLGRLRMIR